MPSKQKASSEPQIKRNKSVSVSQSDFPAFLLDDAIRVAKSIFDNYAGQPEAPHNIAIALEMNPTGTQWRMISSAALAYGLTTAGWGADRIGLPPLGKAIVAPTVEGADVEAKRQALLIPKVQGSFFRKFDRNKLPKDPILNNILVEAGLPKDKADFYRDLLIKNGRATGVIRDVSGGAFVALELGRPAANTPPQDTGEQLPEESELPVELKALVAQPEPKVPGRPAATWDLPVSAVFISHGKNQKILDQLKQIVAFGKFDRSFPKIRKQCQNPFPISTRDTRN